MKILFISPLRVRKGLSATFFYSHFPPMGLHRLQSLTPKNWESRIINEQFEKITFKEEADIVAISAMTPAATRAYEISETYRKRGIKTIMGGIHPSMLPEEALQHCDSVFIGEADDLWPKVLEDFSGDGLKRTYGTDKLPDISLEKGENLVEVPFGVPGFRIPITRTTRGCSIGCDFCSVSRFSGSAIRHRPISAVIKEIETFFSQNRTLRRYIVILDDNIAIDSVYAGKLFDALAPLKIRWLAQTCVNLVYNKELFKKAVRSGMCIGFIGFESIQKNDLDVGISRAKGLWSDRYSEAIKIMHAEGVGLEGAFIFGLDHHDEDVFEITVEWALKNSIDICQFALLTPLPGTRTFEKLSHEGRITAVKNGKYQWEKFNLGEAVFVPKLMNQEKLQEGLAWAYRNFYSCSSIFNRFNNWMWENRPGLDNMLAFLGNIDFRRGSLMNLI